LALETEAGRQPSDAGDDNAEDQRKEFLGVPKIPNWVLESLAMTVTLKPDLEEELTARAQAEGLTTEEFVNRELEKIVAAQPQSSKLSPQERARLLLEWTEQHGYDGPPLSDYAESRDSVYKEREDAQL